MKELTQISSAVITALNAAGLHAIAAFPAQGIKQCPGPIAAVAVGAAEGKALGFCNYLGETYDEDAGTVREIYGKQLEGIITVDIWAERAADCEDGCETAAEVLMGGLPEGIRAGELNWEGICWEKETGMFLRKGKLQCQALFVAKTDEEESLFLNFRLRGVMTE